MERITQIINDWDPIGFFPMAPKDEYINEIKKINEFVSSNCNLQACTLAQEINKIFVETFGTDVYDENLEQCTIVNFICMNYTILIFLAVMLKVH